MAALGNFYENQPNLQFPMNGVPEIHFENICHHPVQHEIQMQKLGYAL